MKEKMLVVCDSEIRYANRLAENITRRKELFVKVHTCSNIEKAKHLANEHEIHMLVVDEKYKYDERCKVHAKHVFVLGKEKVTDLGAKEVGIFKYQCADEIIRQIFETYVENTNENIMRRKQKGRAKLIAVYSPIHRVGKTTFAIALGLAYAQKERVLYLNLEEYAGFARPYQEGTNLGDLLYHVKQGNEHLDARLQAAARKMEEMDYIEPIAVSMDLKEVTLNEWEVLLEQIVESGTYERVILDVGESIQGLYEILEKCEYIYTPMLEDEISQRKIERYYQNLEQMKRDKILKNTSRFVMPGNVEEYAKIRMKEEM